MSTNVDTQNAVQFYNQLDDICVSGLRQALNPQTHVYDRQILDNQWVHTYDAYPTEDLTSTAICLIGIHRAGLAPSSLDLDPQQTLRAMTALARRRNYPGGFGLVVWANAVWDGLPLDELQAECGVDLSHIARHVKAITTMETAWLASGLAHEYRRSGDERALALLDACIDELIGQRYQPATRIMAHAGEAAEFGHGMRRWIANFADQIYSVQAFAFHALLTGSERSRKTAGDLAGQMVAMQGELGQWWWHYDARRGGSPQPYSVYSVHQHGMAPMALYALRAAGGDDHEAAIAASRRWLVDNELGVSMIDPDKPTIWRSLDYDEGRVHEVVRKTRSLLGLAGDLSASASRPALKLNYETRPYEWAWCLYAGAIAREVAAPAHLV